MPFRLSGAFPFDSSSVATISPRPHLSTCQQPGHNIPKRSINILFHLKLGIHQDPTRGSSCGKIGVCHPTMGKLKSLINPMSPGSRSRFSTSSSRGHHNLLLEPAVFTGFSCLVASCACLPCSMLMSITDYSSFNDKSEDILQQSES